MHFDNDATRHVALWAANDYPAYQAMVPAARVSLAELERVGLLFLRAGGWPRFGRVECAAGVVAERLRADQLGAGPGRVDR